MDTGGMRITLKDDRREAILSRLQHFYGETFDETLSRYRAERLLEFFVRSLGPAVYNQGVQDARKYLLEKLDDLDGDVYEAEEPA